jgi:hypothetical protein
LRGYGKAGVVEAIRMAGGEVYAITSEPQSLADNAQREWETGIAHVGDPHHEIAGACADRGWLSLFSNDWGSDIVGAGPTWVSHPKGYFQPGVLGLGREGRVLYRWRCRPNRQNVGGAIARPTPSHVWSRVQAALQEPPDAPDVAPDADPELDSPPVPWPLFVALLIANGWFLRPVPFDQRPGKDTVPQRQRNAMRRIPLFVAAWIAAGLLLPMWVVALVFAGWVAKIVPGILLVNRRFQNVGPDEEPA